MPDKGFMGKGDGGIPLQTSDVLELEPPVNCGYSECGKTIPDGATALRASDGSIYCSNGCSMLDFVKGNEASDSLGAVKIKYK